MPGKKSRQHWDWFIKSWHSLVNIKSWWISSSLIAPRLSHFGMDEILVTNSDRTSQAHGLREVELADACDVRLDPNEIPELLPQGSMAATHFDMKNGGSLPRSKLALPGTQQYRSSLDIALGHWWSASPPTIRPIVRNLVFTWESTAAQPRWSLRPGQCLGPASPED